MAQNIFEQYGIKEVADVQFEALEEDSRIGVKKGDIVLYLDTLKVSTIETSAEQTEARGGKGNTALVIWDYGREITLNLTDALFTPASLAVMMGGKGVEATSEKKLTVRYTQDVEKFSATNGVTLDHTMKTGTQLRYLDMTAGARGSVASVQALKAVTALADHKLKLFYDIEVGGGNEAAYAITIDSETFPGTYKVYGDTVVRNTNGKDTAFQFVIPKAKVGSSVNFTMEAEGDPTTFEMSLRVMRTDDHEMLKLIKYELPDNT